MTSDVSSYDLATNPIRAARKVPAARGFGKHTDLINKIKWKIIINTKSAQLCHKPPQKPSVSGKDQVEAAVPGLKIKKKHRKNELESQAFWRGRV